MKKRTIINMLILLLIFGYLVSKIQYKDHYNDAEEYYFSFLGYNIGCQFIDSVTRCRPFIYKNDLIGEPIRALETQQRVNNTRRIEECKKFPTLYDENCKLKQNIISAYDKEVEKEKETISDLTKAIKLNPNDALNYQLRGRSYMSSFTEGNYSKAISDFDKAIKLNPNDALNYKLRGASYSAEGNYSKAISDFDKAIELDPNDAFIYEHRSINHTKQGDSDKAAYDLNKACELDKQFCK